MGDEKQIIAQIEAYIHQGGGEYGDWFIGLADNPIDPVMEVTRLHKVQNHRFSYIETVSHQIARAVADYFVNTCGTDGNIREIDAGKPCQSIYVYKKTERIAAHESALPVQGIGNQSANLSAQGTLSV
jgi:hypothetical protein